MVERTAEGRERASWDSERVRRLRRHLDETQGELAERLGTRQQTVSEWETGHSRPRRMSQRLLRMVAEESGFYAAEPAAAEPQTNAPTGPQTDAAVEPPSYDQPAREQRA